MMNDAESEAILRLFSAPRDARAELRQVLADDLMRRADPRGELMAIQFAHEHGRANDASRAREAELLREELPKLLGELDTAVVHEHARFRWGFLDDARLGRSMPAHLAHSPAWASVRCLRGDGGSVAFWAEAPLLSLSEVRGIHATHAFALLDREPPPALRVLEVERDAGVERVPSWTELIDRIDRHGKEHLEELGLPAFRLPLELLYITRNLTHLSRLRLVALPVRQLGRLLETHPHLLELAVLELGEERVWAHWTTPHPGERHLEIRSYGGLFPRTLLEHLQLLPDIFTEIVIKGDVFGIEVDAQLQREIRRELDGRPGLRNYRLPWTRLALPAG